MERDLVLPSVVEPRGAGGLVGRHVLRVLQLAAIQEVLRDARRPERVAADGGQDAGVAGPALDHAVGVNAVQTFIREPSGPDVCRAEQRRALLVGDPDGVLLGLQIGFLLVVAGERVFLTSFFMQSYP